MLNYSLHFLRNGRVHSEQTFQAAGDRLAKMFVDTARRGRAAELWNSARLVRNYPAGS